jgi:hypothetical protein
MIAPIFLSASEPNPQRSPEYWDSRKLLNVREAVRAFCGHALPRYPVVFGAHPAITPMVTNMAERIAYDAKLREEEEKKQKAQGTEAKKTGEGAQAAPPPRIVRFQSGLFVDRKSSDDEVVTEALNENGNAMPRKIGMRNESLLLMRYAMIAKPTLPPGLHDDAYHWMLHNYADTFGAERRQRLGTYEFSAAVFIGGMEGIVREFRIFRSFHPNTPAFPIASTGAACEGLLKQASDNLRPQMVDELRGETAYSLLMQKILPPHIAETKDLAAAKAAVWRGGPPPRFSLADHADPAEINERFPREER